MFNPRTGRWTQPDPHWSLANSIFGDEPRRINERTDSQGLHTYTMVPDIWAIIQSGNLYMYVMHNPVRFIDLDGLAARCIKRKLDTGGSGGGGKGPGGGTRIPSGAGVPTPPTRIVTPQPIPKTQTATSSTVSSQKPAQLVIQNVQFQVSKLQHAFAKHGSDFGVTGNWNSATRATFEQAIRSHMGSTSSQIKGTYRGTQDVLHFFNSDTNLNVMVDMSGNFVGGWKLSPQQVENLLRSGNVQ